eukprot:sb/3461421/
MSIGLRTAVGITILQLLATLGEGFLHPLECKITPLNGFLKRVCTHQFSNTPHLDGLALFQCHNSADYYYALKSDTNRWIFNVTCPYDPLHYEMCGYLPGQLGAVVTPEENGLCGVAACKAGPRSFFARSIQDICNPTSALGGDECTDSDVTGLCDSVRQTCDGVCDTVMCEDEIHCGEFTYGYLCNDINGWTTPIFACIFNRFFYYKNICGVSGDTRSCVHEPGVATCTVNYVGDLFQVPIFNFTRCTTIRVNHRWTWDLRESVTVQSRGYFYSPHCINFMEQTNCSDPARVALSCPIRGYMSTVSKVMVCGGLSQGLCDDKLDNLCVDVTSTCRIHKHQVCDDIRDCPDGHDELHCKWMTGTGCERKFRRDMYFPSFPLYWLGDGVEDCVDGTDEVLDQWPTCGTGQFRRFVVDSATCKDVFHCQFGPRRIIPSNLLCDGVDTCGNENAVCRRLVSEVFHRAVQDTVWNKYIGQCLPGLDNMINLVGGCSEFSSSKMRNSAIFGVDRETTVTAPKKASCLYTFGEVYVYLSCLGVCSETCPISKSPLKIDSCPAEVKNRLYTISYENVLTFVTIKEQSFGQEIFECDNKKCLPFEKVCNLIDDCGDGSDEEKCENNFRCRTSEGQSHQLYFPLYKMCDGVPNCMDLSDECNDRCGKEILQGYHLKTSAFVLGSLAIGLNLWTLGKVFLELQTVESQVCLENRLLVATISVGDLLTGVYLLAIAFFDALQGNYCERQNYWLASRTCDILAIVNTTGSAVSVIAMTVLSMFRVRGVRAGLHRANSGISLKNPLTLSCCIVIVSVVFALFPVILLREFEDVFGNGQIWDEDLRFFIGKIDKAEHLEVIEAYYGRILRNSAVQSWDKIISLIRGMYTDDYGNLRDLNSLIGFYGNEGVCLFKFFVLPDDPQFTFSLTYQLFNIVCLAVICSCYIYIEGSSRRSLANLGRGMEQERRLNPALQARIKRQQKIQRKVSMIIVTDFICWLPLLIVSFCHMAEVVDATPYYGIFSVIILPINSSINPLLYSDYVLNLAHTVAGWKCWKRKTPDPRPEVIEMNVIRNSNSAALPESQRVEQCSTDHIIAQREG